ncbi:prephenate dehydrogenase [Pseudodesulfovibrio tunisiensis]|uniref:prephenate dehydrogenase n=1 Tax=Pseudodesulfovibrio tunisiensis TaxID=463192 RepID=UPI001FB26A8C|nr:prephenate dehydrogenase [Pseudodesulfovibrio tunisiensis]
MADPDFHRIAIAGANGQMGQLFTRKLRELGCEVAELNRPFRDEDVAAALDNCDLFLLSVPVTAMKDVLATVQPHLKASTILADVGSVKVMPIKVMTRAHAGPVVGTHPLFGPVIPEGFEPRVAVTPGRESDEQAARRVARLMEACGYTAFRTTAEEHDKAMAFVQGLNFTTTVAYLAAMRDVEHIENYVTPSLKRRLDSAHKMTTQDMELFEVISEANPFLQETTRHFMSYLGLAAGGDLDLLAQRANWWWRHEQQQEGCIR